MSLVTTGIIRSRCWIKLMSITNTNIQHFSTVPKCYLKLKHYPRSYKLPHFFYNSTVSFQQFSSKAVPNPLTLEEIYQHDENKNADDFIRNNRAYRSTIFHPQEFSGQFHPCLNNLIKAAQDTTHSHFPITADINKNIVEEALSSLKILNDEELLHVLYHIRSFAPCHSATDPSYVRIWARLDKECASRSASWALDYLLTVADLWFGLRLARLSTFHENLIKKLFRKCDHLNKVQFIRFMFCLNLVRTFPDTIGTYDVEHYLTQVADHLSSMEVVVVAMAFFKTETAVRDPALLEKLLGIIQADADKLDSISIAAVAKFARFCSNVKCKDALVRFQGTFLPEIDRLSIPACTHLALIGTQSQIPHMELINAVIQKVQRNVKDARLKELERISLAMTMFNADCDELCRLIVDELRSSERAQEIRSYGRCLPAILHYLSMREVYSQDLLNTVLGRDFRNTYYGKNSEYYQRELLCLDFCAELDIENYSGSRLDQKTRERLLEKNATRLTRGTKAKISRFEAALMNVAKLLESLLGGREFIHICNILPQHNSIKIVFCTDETVQSKGKAVHVPATYKMKKDYEIKTIPQDLSIRYHVVYFCNRNDFIESESQLSGSAQLQIRQLKKMGYLIHIVPPKFNEDQFKNDILNSCATVSKTNHSSSS